MSQNFHDADHPRSGDGKFATKTQPEQASTDLLSGRNTTEHEPGHEARPGDAMREQARKLEQERAASWDRSDTDGSLSQWAGGLGADRARLQASIDDAGGVALFAALADLDGNLVPAKRISTRYGSAWGLLSDPEDPHSDFDGFVNESKAADPEKAAANMAKKGYRIVTVKAPARADLAGSGTGLAGALSVRAVVHRTDGGFSKDAQIIPDEDSVIW